MALISKKSSRSASDRRAVVRLCLAVFLVLCLANSLLSQGEVGSFLYETAETEVVVSAAAGAERVEDVEEKQTEIVVQRLEKISAAGKEKKTEKAQVKIPRIKPKTERVEIISTAVEEKETPPAKTKTFTNAPIPLSSAAKQFYKKHQREMKKLMNITTIMDWNRSRRKRGKYRQWLDEFDYYEIEKDTANLEGAQGYDFLYASNDLCQVAQLFQKHSSSLPHVLLLRYNQDFGGLSSDLGGSNYPMRNLPKLWKKQGCTLESILEYVNHPDMLAIFTNQFQMVKHDKIISIPLGLSGSPPDLLLKHIEQTTEQPIDNRTQLFMLNTNLQQKRNRARDVRVLLSNFHHKIRNTYPIYTRMAKGKDSFASTTARTLYYNELRTSQFVWSPPGLGLDCYRHWEGLYLGAIPVLSHNHRFETDGWLSNIFKELPVAWIDSYDNLTPQHLETEYQRIVENWESYDYRKLTRQYWIDLAHSYVEKNKESKRD